MVKNNQGLTETYNRFHDPMERHNDIIKLRQLHQEMDAAVLKAYGWQDIPTDCDFLLDYEEEEEDNNSKKKKPWRYRWPEEIHDQVLGRLLELNKQRYQEEVLGGKLAQKKTPKSKGAKKTRKKASQENSEYVQPELNLDS